MHGACGGENRLPKPRKAAPPAHIKWQNEERKRFKELVAPGRPLTPSEVEDMEQSVTRRWREMKESGEAAELYRQARDQRVAGDKGARHHDHGDLPDPAANTASPSCMGPWGFGTPEDIIGMTRLADELDAVKKDASKDWLLCTLKHFDSFGFRGDVPERSHRRAGGAACVTRAQTAGRGLAVGAARPCPAGCARARVAQRRDVCHT